MPTSPILPASTVLFPPSRLTGRKQPVTPRSLRAEETSAPGWQWVRVSSIPLGVITIEWSDSTKHGAVRMRSSTAGLISVPLYDDILTSLYDVAQKDGGRAHHFKIVGGQWVPFAGGKDDLPDLESLQGKVGRLGALLAECSGELLLPTEQGSRKQQETLKAYFRVAKEIREAEEWIAKLREQFGVCQEFVTAMMDDSE